MRLIAYGTPILAIITASLQHPALLINEDSLATAIRVRALYTLIIKGYEVMAHGRQGSTYRRLPAA